MYYTNQRRRELNKALFIKLQNPLLENFAEEGDPHMILEKLPLNAEEVISEDCLVRNIPFSPIPWNKVMPVFFPVNYNGRKGYMAAFVNRSDKSIRAALEKLNSCGLYYISGMTLEKGADYGRV